MNGTTSIIRLKYDEENERNLIDTNIDLVADIEVRVVTVLYNIM